MQYDRSRWSEIEAEVRRLRDCGVVVMATIERPPATYIADAVTARSAVRMRGWNSGGHRIIHSLST